ncbi:hypothetical protein Taro_024889 [Colocasia esculenta]|uniref:EF-hand domain-containing protein n=1 Tax=Colocasia esculenta TaxID=4460 RepID=A0A843VCL2_COLES|nr:hypothetical protein [Colocasia esculenta]
MVRRDPKNLGGLEDPPTSAEDLWAMVAKTDADGDGYIDLVSIVALNTGMRQMCDACVMEESLAFRSWWITSWNGEVAESTLSMEFGRTWAKDAQCCCLVHVAETTSALSEIGGVGDGNGGVVVSKLHNSRALEAPGLKALKLGFGPATWGLLMQQVEALEGRKCLEKKLEMKLLKVALFPTKLHA